MGLKLMYIIYKDPTRTLQKIKFASVRKSNRVMLFYKGKESLLIVKIIGNTLRDTLYGLNFSVKLGGR
jgi:hypothetical protein